MSTFQERLRRLRVNRNIMAKSMADNLGISYRNYQRYERGKTCCPLKIIGDTDAHGTTTTFKPDYQIFEELVFDYNTLLVRFREMAFLNRGVKIIINDNRGESPVSETLHYEGGIISYVEFLNRKETVLHPSPIYLELLNRCYMCLQCSQICRTYFLRNVHNR